MLYLITTIISIIFPFLGLWGFIAEINYLMIFAIVWSNFAFLSAYLKGQKYQMKFLILSYIIGLFIHFIFNIPFVKSFTISFVFPNLLLTFFMIIISFISKKRG